MDVIWIISFKITAEIEVRKHAFCVLLRRRAMFYQCDGIRLNSFFTVNNQVIFLKCIFGSISFKRRFHAFVRSFFAVLFYLLICCSVVVFFEFIYFLLPIGLFPFILTSGPYSLLRKQSALPLGVVYIEVPTV